MRVNKKTARSVGRFGFYEFGLQEYDASTVPTESGLLFRVIIIVVVIALFSLVVMGKQVCPFIVA